MAALSVGPATARAADAPSPAAAIPAAPAATPAATSAASAQTPATSAAAGPAGPADGPEAHAGGEIRSTLEDQQAVAVTIYNDDLALVKDRRSVRLPAGRVHLALRDVSARIRPQTALLRATDATGDVHVVEQNFDFDLLTPASLLEKYVGREVGIVRTHPTTGAETEETATVLAASDGVVLRIGDRIETGRPGDLPGRLVYRDIPENLRDRPTLVLTLDSSSGGERAVELSYLTGGLGWQADYVGELSADERTLDLTGWVTLENRSGTGYRNARLQLVAGDVNLVADQRRRAMQADNVMVSAAAPPSFAEESLFEYHLYTLSEPTSIADNQSKQVSLLNASGVGVTKELLIGGQQDVFRRAVGGVGRKLDVSVFLEMSNDRASNLGMPLPKGVVRIYKRDAAGNTQFVGEDRIDHTPKNETVRLMLGKAFDVTAEGRQTDFEKLSGTGPWQYQFESAYEVEIRNAKSEPVTVTLQERIPGDWTMLQESAPHEKASAGVARWRLLVPAEGKIVLTYRVRVRV
ncbi:MAG: DUF4139 domain-containing protein [Thiohalocapsa sp.]|nr:DUF4139 domain-containing protein [Thiohalocapsa sp.]